MRRGHIPQRTCAGCRAVAAQHELVRVGFVGPHLVIGRVSGRGAYVHPSQGCLDLALRGGFARSFRRPIPPNQIPHFPKNVAGLRGSNAVETPSRTTGASD
ncbi:MAG: YlxR family protein [Kofleriaceae bacterium]|nr:YlxR family protein [Kofleriaceae bacterium]